MLCGIRQPQTAVYGGVHVMWNKATSDNSIWWCACYVEYGNLRQQYMVVCMLCGIKQPQTTVYGGVHVMWNKATSDNSIWWCACYVE